MMKQKQRREFPGVGPSQDVKTEREKEGAINTAIIQAPNKPVPGDVLTRPFAARYRNPLLLSFPQLVRTLALKKAQHMIKFMS
jgi:hypothetical protein